MLSLLVYNERREKIFPKNHNKPPPFAMMKRKEKTANVSCFPKVVLLSSKNVQIFCFLSFNIWKAKTQHNSIRHFVSHIQCATSNVRSNDSLFLVTNRRSFTRVQIFYVVFYPTTVYRCQILIAKCLLSVEFLVQQKD